MEAKDYQALFEASPTALLVVAVPDWTIVTANDARLRLTGADRSDQVGRRLFDLFPDDPADPNADGVHNLSASFARVLATKAADTMPVQRYAVRNADGRFEERWWSPVNAPVLGADGEVVLIIHRVEEVTDIVRLRNEAEASDRQARRQQAVIERLLATEAELRKSEEFNRRILASSADCIKVLDLDANLEFMSEGGMCVMEVDDFGVIEGACWPDFWKGDLHPLAWAAVEEAKKGRTGRFHGPSPTLKGTMRWWDVIVTAMAGPDGRPEKLLSISRDVSAAKGAEVRLREMNETLEERVADRTMDLVQAQEALRQSQKLEAVGQLTGGVAHDFNNLLTIIRSSVDFLRRPDLAEERRRRYMDAVSDTVDRATKLTGQLLAFARRQALKPEVFEVGARLHTLADMLDTLTGARIRVVTEVPDLTCFVRADLSQFETALVNMAVNARDAMDGEGTLTLRLACGVPMPSIRGHTGAPGPFAAVSLADTGLGIPHEMVGRIFEPFFTTKEVGKGTGLGLSQVFGFAKQSGGDVEVESELGAGTTFTLYLPGVEAEGGPAEPEAQTPDVAPQASGQCVLVVEDNVEVGRFATQILEDLGYRCVWATNAEEALDRIGADGSGFDAVFSDVVMPGMGGIALARELQRRLPDMPVVLASGYSHVLAQETGHGFELLHKPYSADQVSRILRKVLAQAHPRRAPRSAT